MKETSGILECENTPNLNRRLLNSQPAASIISADFDRPINAQGDIVFPLTSIEPHCLDSGELCSRSWLKRLG
jgi:hypothetical protein